MQPTLRAAFRLFSTQKGLEKVVIKEAEEVWPVVADPRVRCVLSSAFVCCVDLTQATLVLQRRSR
jgi:hypothetical protein